jgi:hypothetical protein
MALVVKPVHLGDLPALVVATNEGYVRRVARFHQKEVGKRLNTVAAPIDEISHENVAFVRDLAADVEQLQQVVKLSVNVPTHGDGGGYGLDGRLLHEKHFDHVA